MRAVRYLVTECNYGGHVTDDNDRRLLKTLLLNFINRGVAFESGYSISETGYEKTKSKSNCLFLFLFHIII